MSVFAHILLLFHLQGDCRHQPLLIRGGPGPECQHASKLAASLSRGIHFCSLTATDKSFQAAPEALILRVPVARFESAAVERERLNGGVEIGNKTFFIKRYKCRNRFDLDHTAHRSVGT